eukprot:CAMPEP_0202733678 /NCGR_PEP_ID=MMETSP1385-20130828/188291_1 /ASSEMBLY_ACC=CAM_ASM_000861 /TAXON_ID=933848 /ORGANISM="Elphidium margaritaceum" /LENGTH=806 /DNA_ID=CAMNT_0049400017 /DNA_START=1 /DNA_END=2421 /DNA_ORIENTATION=-
MILVREVLHAYILTFFIAFTVRHVHCQIVQCNGATCSCPSSLSNIDQTCTLKCAFPDICKEQSVLCRTGDACEVICDGKSSCSSGTVIDGHAASDVTVRCNAEDACKQDSTISCGSGHCQLFCAHRTSCEDIGDIDVSRALSFHCYGYCPSTVPASFTPKPTNTPTTHTPTKSPTTSSPTPSPTAVPTISPTQSPSPAPTNSPTRAPTNSPTKSPTVLPTYSPTRSPTSLPTKSPTRAPSQSPTRLPTYAPSQSPTDLPTNTPTLKPTNIPTPSPTSAPTNQPSVSPTNLPTLSPTLPPTLSPTRFPTNSPTKIPTESPTKLPSHVPTNFPSSSPTAAPTPKPTASSSNASKAPTQLSLTTKLPTITMSMSEASSANISASSNHSTATSTSSPTSTPPPRTSSTVQTIQQIHQKNETSFWSLGIAWLIMIVAGLVLLCCAVAIALVCLAHRNAVHKTSNSSARKNECKRKTRTRTRLSLHRLPSQSPSVCDDEAADVVRTSDPFAVCIGTMHAQYMYDGLRQTANEPSGDDIAGDDEYNCHGGDDEDAHSDSSSSHGLYEDCHHQQHRTSTSTATSDMPEAQATKNANRFRLASIVRWNREKARTARNHSYCSLPSRSVRRTAGSATNSQSNSPSPSDVPNQAEPPIYYTHESPPYNHDDENAVPPSIPRSHSDKNNYDDDDGEYNAFADLKHLFVDVEQFMFRRDGEESPPSSDDDEDDDDDDCKKSVHVPGQQALAPDDLPQLRISVLSAADEFECDGDRDIKSNTDSHSMRTPYGKHLLPVNAYEEQRLRINTLGSSCLGSYD